MRRLLAAALAVGLAFAPADGRAESAPGANLFNGGKIAWRPVGPGIQESTKTGKPALMLLHAVWCKFCKKYQAVFKDPRVVAASRDFVMILIDIDKDPNANSSFSPDGTYVPRTIFYNKDGDVIEAAKGRDPQYPHSIDVDEPDELLSLMAKAKAAGGGGGGDGPGSPGLLDQRAEVRGGLN